MTNKEVKQGHDQFEPPTPNTIKEYFTSIPLELKLKEKFVEHFERKNRGTTFQTTQLPKASSEHFSIPLVSRYAKQYTLCTRACIIIIAKCQFTYYLNHNI